MKHTVCELYLTENTDFNYTLTQTIADVVGNDLKAIYCQ